MAKQKIAYLVKYLGRFELYKFHYFSKQEKNQLVCMNNITTDFSEFGYRERKMAEELLKASREQGFPNDFEDDDTIIMFNTYSGNVFFTNSDYQVAMINGDKLELFYSCPVCGHEGFLKEMEHGKDDDECQEYLRETL